MVGGFLGFILLVVVAYFAFLALRIYAGFKRMRRQVRGGPAAPKAQGMMVKDEVCGTYIPREEALTETRDGVERFYCSEECRRKAGAR
jgi:uncharacterized protein